MIHVGAGWLGHEKKDALALVGSGRVGGTVARSHVFASKGAFSTFVYIQGSVLGHWPDDLHSYITCSHLELLSLSVEREFPSGAERSIRLSDWLSRPPSHADTRVEEGCFFFFSLARCIHKCRQHPWSTASCTQKFSTIHGSVTDPPRNKNASVERKPKYGLAR